MLELDGSGTIPISQFTGITGGGIDVTGGNYSPTAATANSNNSFTNLSNIDGSGLFVSRRQPDPAGCHRAIRPSVIPMNSPSLATSLRGDRAQFHAEPAGTRFDRREHHAITTINPLTIEAAGRRPGGARRLDLDRHGGL